MNIEYELDSLKFTLQQRNFDHAYISYLVDSARLDIEDAVKTRLADAMDRAIEAGVDKESSDFINDLDIDVNAAELITRSGRTDFSMPELQMLPYLLQNAKPMKDGSGVYKTIPVGGESSSDNSKDRKFLTNIFDAQKAVIAERKMNAKVKNKTPTLAKPQFRTATSKQNAATQWVLPPKEADFRELLIDINEELRAAVREDITTILRQYEEVP